MNIIKSFIARIFLSGDKLEKKLADIHHEPWVKVVTVTLADPNDPSKGYFELDWNNLFIESLYEAGYSGRSDAEVVDQWFNDLCRGMLNEDIE